MMSRHDDDGLPRGVEDLRAFEREYRTRLALHLEEGLARLRGTDDAQPLRVAARRLGDASDADLAEVLAELPEGRRQRLLEALLRVPVQEVTG